MSQFLAVPERRCESREVTFLVIETISIKDIMQTKHMTPVPKTHSKAWLLNEEWKDEGACGEYEEHDGMNPSRAKPSAL